VHQGHGEREACNPCRAAAKIKKGSATRTGTYPRCDKQRHLFDDYDNTHDALVPASNIPTGRSTVVALSPTIIGSSPKVALLFVSEYVIAGGHSRTIRTTTMALGDDRVDNRRPSCMRKAFLSALLPS
jgi:hypothetical protein